MEQIIVTHVDGSTLKLQSKENVSNITKAVQNVEKLGADTVDISVVSATKLIFSIGDKITIFGRDYTLNTPANEKKITESRFEYDLQFEGVQYDLLRAAYSVNVDTTSGKVQDLNGDSLTGDIKMFLDVLIANANRVFPGKWILGTYPLDTETRTETFGDADNCLTVLQSLCGEDKYNTEFSIEIGVGGVRTINIGATGKLHTYTFEYGKGKGLNELVRDKQSSSNIITRLNVFGSSKNINTSKYRAFKLCLPGKTKSQSYLENADSISAYGVWEGTKLFEDIYPHRTGVISAIGSSELVFTDSSMDFDLNEKDGEATKYLINGSSAKVHFNSGALAGYEFDLLSYNHTTKVFTVKPITDENGYTFPSPTSSAFQFAVGDKYVLLDIYLPQSYIDAAESELAVKGQEYLDKYSQPLVQYGLTLDSSFLQNIVGADAESNIIWPGDYIPIKDTDLNVDKPIRVKGISRNLLEDYDYNITISDLGTKVSTITRIISSISGIDKLIQINSLNDPARARRNYLSAQEVLSMIFDTDGDYYTDKIKPLSIETSMLSVGAKSRQFDLTGTVLNPNYGGAKNRIIYVGGVLSHSTILDEANNPRVWNIGDGDIVLSTDSAYYIYAKCIKVGTGASLLFSTSKITVESDPNYYHFLIGIANSVNPQNARSLALMYGFATINGRFITAGRIQSGDGVTYFDLDSGEMQGKITFKAGSSGYANLTDKPDLSVYSLTSYVDSIKSNLQGQIDGQLISYFGDIDPTPTNYPASEWATDLLKNQHANDTYTNTSSGGCWRYQQINSVWGWGVISDTATQQALIAAGNAQTTANSKKRVFSVQPYAPYDVGDLWAKGTAIYKCDIPKIDGQAFAESDWSVTATDDTAVNNLQIGGRNYARNTGGVFEASSSDYRFWGDNLPVVSNVAGKTITISCEAKVISSAGNDVQLLLVAFDPSWSIFSASVLTTANRNTWEKIEKTFVVPEGYNGDILLQAYNYPNGNEGEVAMRYPKLEFGNKATDYTPNPDEVAADIATAQATANAANAKIVDMAADGKITPVEKKSLSQLVDQVLAEENILVDQADVYGVDFATYVSCKNAVLSYTGPLLSDMSATSAVDRATLEQLFSDYNTAKINLLNAISNAINGTATTALTQASAVFPSDSGLLAYWGFDEVPEIPDGAYIYKSKQGWTSGVDGWEANGGALTIDSGLLKVAGGNTSGIGMYRGWQADFENKSLIFKVKSKNKIQNAAVYTNSGYSDVLNPTIIDDYTWIVRFDNIHNNGYSALIIAVNRDLTNTEDGWIEWIYIGDGSYATTISDNSGNGRALTNQGALAVSTGISGKSLSFNGASQAIIDSKDFRNSKFTISAWFKSPGMGVGQTIGGILCITYSARLVLNQNGTILLSVFGNGEWIITGATSLFGGWHHVAAIYTGTEIKIYVDGVLVGSTSAVIVWNQVNPLYIGTDPNNSPWHFNGLIDEVRIYNRDLSGAEVLGLYKHVTKGKAFAVDTEMAYLKEAMANDTNITGGLVATSILKLGAVNQSGAWIEKAGISGVGFGGVPRVWTGGTMQEAINRIAGNNTVKMFVATDEGKLYADKGEIGGFDITQQGIEKEQSITDNGVTFTGKISVDWLNQAISFFRDGIARVIVSAKAITSGIPSPVDVTVATGTWKNMIWFPGFYGQTIGDSSILGPRNVLTPGGYTAKNIVNVFFDMPQWADGEVPTWQCYLNVTLNIWRTDASNAKIGLLCSITKSISLKDTLVQVVLPVSFSLDVSTGISHEIYVSGNDTSYTTLDGEKMALRCNRGQSQQSMVYSAQAEAFEIGFSGFRIMATNLWCYFNTKDNANKHFRMRGNAELVSKSAIVTLNLDDETFRVSTIQLQGTTLNILNKTSSYTIVANDRSIAGLKNVNPPADCTFTLPSLNDVDTNGVYYNNNRVLTFVSTTRNLTLAAASGQNIRNAPTYVMGTNVGYSFLGDRASLQWLIIS